MKRTKPGEALFLLLRAHRVASDQVDERLRELDGLSLPLWEVLVIVSMAPEMKLRMADITRRMLVSKSNVTKLIDKLDRAGLVRREDSPTDRRVVLASLTPKGIEAVKRGGDIFNEAAREYVERHMTASEMKSLGSGLSKLISASSPGA